MYHLQNKYVLVTKEKIVTQQGRNLADATHASNQADRHKE